MGNFWNLLIIIALIHVITFFHLWINFCNHLADSLRAAHNAVLFALNYSPYCVALVVLVRILGLLINFWMVLRISYIMLRARSADIL